MVGAAVVGGFACGERPAPPPAEAGTTAAGSPVPADSLVATTPDGTELWFTLTRPDTGGGWSCADRALEIRRGTKRTPVPLLYTGVAPEVVNDSTVRARLSTHCRPGPAYLVNLRTGQPVREQP